MNEVKELMGLKEYKIKILSVEEVKINNEKIPSFSVKSLKKHFLDLYL